MMARLGLALLICSTVALWIWQGRGSVVNRTVAAAGSDQAPEPGYIANDAELIQTGDDGQPLYRLNAQRIEQVKPAANIFLGAPRLNYQPGVAATWTLTADRGVLTADARRVDLYGTVRADGTGSTEQPLKIRTEQLAVDMQRQDISSEIAVAIDWGRLRLTALGMHINLKDGSLRLESQGHGEVAR